MSALSGHAGHTYDVYSATSGSKNTGTFVRNDKVYDGSALLANGCDASAGFVANVGDIVGAPITWCNDTGVNAWSSSFASTGPISTNHDDIAPAYSYYSSTGALVSVAGRRLAHSFTKQGVTRTGQQILTGGCRIPDPVDECSNLSGNQSEVPAGLQQFGTRCLGAATGCRVTLSLPLMNVTSISPFSGSQDDFSYDSSDIVDWSTNKRIGIFNSVVDASDQHLATTYYRFTGIGWSTQSLTGAQLLANGCSFTPPAPADVCPNITGNQPSVPADMVHNDAGGCVPAPPSCQFDELGADDGLPAGSGRIAGDGVNDRCVLKPDVSCQFDETPTDTNGNGSKDTCVVNPDITSCQFDETPTDTNGNGSKDTCAPRPDASCGLAVGVDTNGNGSKDTCVKITPIIDCGTLNADGTRTLFWRWRNPSSYTITVPLGLKNVFFHVNQPTVFAPGEGSFTTTLNTAGFLGLNAQAWMITGNTAIGVWRSDLTPSCFEDACPNIVGDQPALPERYAYNDEGACVPETTSCDAEYVLDDSNHDGVNDRCVANPVTDTECRGRVPVDTNGNGVADDCASVQPTLSCVTSLEDGSWKAWFTWTNANAMAVDVPLGSHNALSGGSGELPTSFAPGTGTPFAIVADEGSTQITWTLTVSSATATLESEHCFTDMCPNLTGDQATGDCGSATTDPGSSAAPGGSSSNGGSSSPGDGSSAAGGDTAIDSGESAAPSDTDAGTDTDAGSNGSSEESASPEGVSAAETTVENGSGLPYTGIGLGLLMLIGVGALGAGILSRRAARRRERRQSISG